MPRFVKDIAITDAQNEIETMVHNFLTEHHFYEGEWKGEPCYTTNVSTVKDYYFFKYAFENGNLHIEAWIRDGAHKEQGLTGFACALQKAPYLKAMTELIENILLITPDNENQKDMILAKEMKSQKKYRYLLPILIMIAIGFVVYSLMNSPLFRLW